MAAQPKTVIQDGVRVRVAASWQPPAPDGDVAQPKAKARSRSRSRRQTPAAADPRTPDGTGT